jgi:plastocyanin
MARWTALLCSCLALSLVAAGCGDDEEESGGGGGGAATQEGTGGGGGGGGATSGGTAEVTMAQIQFDPSSVNVPKGGKVTWTNDDSASHDVTKTGGPGPDFSSGEPGGMSQGDTFTHTFDTPGTIEYVCTVHSNMKGTVTVK